MEKSFDLIVIGSGTAGLGAAMKCRKAGWEVAVVDERPFGGTCELRGCDPKKILVGAAELMDWNQRMAGKGVETSGEINWPDLIAFKRTFTKNASENHEKSLKGAGISSLHGHAEFVGEKQIKVGELIYNARYILIATGAVPMPLGFRGAEHMIDSEQFMELEKLPNKIIFAGGGFIAFEFAHIVARTGAEVHIIEMQDRPLANFDPDIVMMLVEKSKKIGIQIHTGTSVDSVERLESGLVVHCMKKGVPEDLEGGLVIHGAGRVANVANLGLEVGKVEFTRKGIVVNDHLQSVSNPIVYAAGDAAASPGLPLTPFASLEGKLAATNMLKGNTAKTEYKVKPSVVFTVPKIGSVGLTEEQALEKGHSCRTINVDMSDWYTYTRTGDSYAMSKIIVDEKTDLILGAHFMGSCADELVNLLAVAIQFDLSSKNLKHMMFAYPAAASDIGYMLP
jgi:glutathione reductase (NADPH)